MGTGKGKKGDAIERPRMAAARPCRDPSQPSQTINTRERLLYRVREYLSHSLQRS